MQSLSPMTYLCPPSCGCSPGSRALIANTMGGLLSPHLLLVRHITDKEMEMPQNGVSSPRSHWW